MTLGLRAAAIASVMAIVASTSAMAQTTGTIPPPAPPSQLQPPPAANQYSPNEIIDAGHQFFGSVSRRSCRRSGESGEQMGPPERLYSW